MSRKTLVSCAWYTPKVLGTPPRPRQGHAIATIEETVYLFGGSTATEDGLKFRFLNDLYKLTVEKDTVQWHEVRQQGSIPTPRDGHSICAVKNKLYLYGGKACLLARECLRGLYVFDTVSAVWRQVTTTGTAPATLGHSLCHVGSALYVIGGLHHSRASSDVWMLHLELNTWVPLRVQGPRPPPRCDHAASVVMSKIYVFGGCGSEDVYYNDLYVLDTGRLTWEAPRVKGSPPPPRAGHTFCVHRTKDIYVFGGTTDTMKTDMTMFADLCKLSLSKPRWKWPLFTGPCAEGRYGHSAVIIHSQLYIIGGIGRKGQFNDVQALHLINPSDREQAIGLVFGSSEMPCYQPTRLPRLSYDLTSQSGTTTSNEGSDLADLTEPANNLGYRDQRDAAAARLQNLKDLQNLKTQTSEAIEKALMDLSERYEDLFSRELQLEESREQLDRDRASYEQMFDKQQQDLAELVDRHRVQTESWLLSRQEENNRERKRITEEKVLLQEEKLSVEAERADLRQRAEQLRCIARQLNHK